MAKSYQQAEAFINDQFPAVTYDGKRCSIDVERSVHAKLVRDNEAHDPEYYGKKPGVVHISSLYRCQRGLLLDMLCMDPPPMDEKQREESNRKLGIFRAGNLFEDFIIEALPNVLERQREYRYEHKGITLVGRADGLVLDGDLKRVVEIKSVNSNAFWYRKREGVLVQWMNQMQLMAYLWLERVLNKNEYDGLFAYVSKDDCVIEGAPVKFNQAIVDEVIIPILDNLAAGYERNKHLIEMYADAKKMLVEGEKSDDVSMKDKARRLLDSIPASVDFTGIDAPPLTVFNPHKKKGEGEYEVNFLTEFSYCPHHTRCAGSGYLMVASDEARRLNKERAVKQMGV